VDARQAISAQHVKERSNLKNHSFLLILAALLRPNGRGFSGA
jgi:hypothetical protein